MDTKLEKPVSFEVIMPKDDKFTVDNPKGTVTPGVETIITFTYKPPEADKFIVIIGLFRKILMYLNM